MAPASVESLPPLRGSQSSGLICDPMARAVGYFLSALRAYAASGMTNPDTANLGYRGILTACQHVAFRLVFAFRLSCLFFRRLMALLSENRGLTPLVFKHLTALGNH